MAEDGFSDGNESEKTLKQKLNKHIQHLQQHTHNNSYTSNTSNTNTSILSNDILKMYIDYCKKYCHPVLTRPAAKILQVWYITLIFPLVWPYFRLLVLFIYRNWDLCSSYFYLIYLPIFPLCLPF